MAAQTWFKWLDKLTRAVRGRQGRSQRRKLRRSTSRPLVLESLEDRVLLASDITIITSGVGSLDSVLAAHNGVITLTDGADGGTQAETISVAALKALPGTDNINIAARNNISFNDLTPAGGTLGLLTSTGHTAVFSAGSGPIQFANLNNNFFTAGGDIDFNAGANLTLCNLTSDGGAINLTTGVGGTFTASAAGGTLASAGGNITISADNIVIQTGIDAAGGTVTLQQATGGAGATTRNIDIGGGTTVGDLDLTDTELGFINAGVLRIGRLDNAGNITVTDNAAATGGITTHVAFNTLDLRSGGSISAADSNARIAVSNLALQSVGNAGTANNQLGGQVATLAANVAGKGDSFFFFNQAKLSIGSVDGVIGITTNDGPIQVFANGASLTVAADIQSQGGSIGLGSLAIINSAAIATGGGQLVLVADNMDLQAGSSIDAGTGRVSLLENSSGTLINLGGADSTSPLTLGLTAAEINTITAGTLQIGDNRAGSITLDAAITPAHVATLDLQTGNAISEGVNGSLTVANLALQAANGIGDNGDIQLLGSTNLAFANGATGNIMISDNGALTVAAVDTLNNTNGNKVGNFASGGAILLTANGGPLTFAISTSSDSITDATTTGTTAGQNNITVNSGVTVAAVEANGVSFFSVDNILLQTGSSVTSANGTVLLSAGAGGIDTAATLTNDGTVNGVNVAFNASGDIGVGTVSAATTATIVSSKGAILDNNDTTTAAVLNITATNLSLSANTGIGVSSTALNLNAAQAPLETQVSNISAETATGGIFLDNGFVAPTTLTVGFTGQPLAGIGVQVTGTSGDIRLINNGSINITNQDLTVRGPGNVTVQANGAAADVTTGGDVNLNAIRGQGSGVVTVQAGHDITLGNAEFGQVQSVSGSIVLAAGHDLTFSNTGFVSVNAGMGAITATAGADISLQAGMQTTGGAINLATGVGGTVSINQGTLNVLSQGGNITISADNISLPSGTLNAGTGVVTLQQATGGAGSTLRNIDIGGGTTAGDLDITDADLSHITAGVVRIGRLDNAGNITITANGMGGGISTHAGFNTLDLRSGGSIQVSDSQNTIAVENLALQSVGSDGSTNNPLTGIVTNLAVNITGQGNGLFFKNKADLSIGSVDGVNGLTSNDGELAVVADPFTITVVDTPAAADVNPNGGLIGFMSNAFVNQGTTTAGAAINSGGGQILILANNMDLQAGSSINAGAGRVSLMEDMDGTPIDLGSPSSTAPLTLGLTAAEINTITASTLQIGDANAGNITITAAIAPTHVSTLVLTTPQAIVEGTNGSLTVANLALQAGNGIGDAGAIQLAGPTNLAFRNTMTGNVMISDNGALTVAAVDILNNTNGNNIGNFASGGAIFLTANGGPLTFAISTSSDSLTDATTTGTTAGQNNITVNSGVAVAAVEANGVSFFSVDNILVQTGSTVTSSNGTVLLSAGVGGADPAATLTNDGTVKGVNVAFNAVGDIGVGTVTATTTATIVSSKGAILDNNDTPTAVLNITATNLSLSANTGIGVPSTALNINATQAPLETQVSNVQAQTATGGIFLSNGSVTPTTLTVGFSGQPLANVGVQVTGASGDIQLVNNGSINITNPGDPISGPGNVTVDANGASSDITTGAGLLGNLFAIEATGNGLVTVQAGRDITLGAASSGQVLSAAGSIVFDAGRNLTFNSTGGAEIFSGTGAITATAGGDITLQQAAVLTQGGAVNLTTGVGGTVTINGGQFPDNSNGGNITISADNFLLNGPLVAGTGIVTLQQATGGTGSTTRNIDIGGGTTAGDLNITDAELGQITAGAVRIGRLDNAGNLTVTQNAAGTGGITTHTGFNTLDLRSGGTILQSNTGNGTIAVANLALQGAENVSATASSVTTLAANLIGRGGSFIFSGDQHSLSIGSVDGINGITTNGGGISVQVNGTLTVTDTPAANDISTPGGGIILIANTFINNGTTTAGAAINGGGGRIEIEADNMNLQAGSTINAGAGRVMLAEFSGAATINLGGPNSTSPLTLGLTEAEINTVTAGTLQIGDTRTNNITITAAIAPAHVSTLDLQSAAAIIEGTNGSLTVANLALQAGNGIGDAGAVQLIGPTNLAFANGLAGNVMISDNGALTITAVDSLNNTIGNNVGNFANGGGIFLTANGGPLTFDISTSSNAATSAATTGAGQNDITVNNGVTVASVKTNNVVFSSADNIDLQTGSMVSSATGNVEFLIGAQDANTVNATLQGTINGSAPFVQAGNGNASVLVDFANGAALPNGLTFTGGPGNNTLTVSDANDNTAHTYTLSGSTIVRDGTAINYTKVGNVTVTGGNQADTFNVTPSPATTFTVNGGNPTPPALPGDILNVNLAGLTTPQLTQSFNPASGFAGTWNFGNAQAVHFTGIETLVPAAADLTLTASGPNANLFADTLAYTYTLTNNGPSNAANVTLTTALPAGINVVSARQLSGNDSFAGAIAVSTVTFTAPVVAAGDTAVFQVIVSVAGGAGRASSLRSTATVTSSSFDPNMGNNAATTPNSLLTVLSNQLQVNQQAFGQLHSPGGEMTALQQFLFWFSNASAVSGGAVPLIVDELLLALGEMATAEGLPLQGFINAQENAIVSNPLYGTVSGYELGLWSGALASILF